MLQAPPSSPTNAFLISVQKNAQDILKAPQDYGLSELSIQKGRLFRSDIVNTLKHALGLGYTAWNAEFRIHEEKGNQYQSYETYTHRLETAIEKFKEQYYTDGHLVTFSILATLLEKNEDRAQTFKSPHKGQTMKSFIDNMFKTLESPASFIDVLAQDYRNKEDKEKPKPSEKKDSILTFPPIK